MNIGVIGCGYVGLTLATILACKQKVSIWDINKDRINDILLGKMPLQDEDLEKQFDDPIAFLDIELANLKKEFESKVTATFDKKEFNTFDDDMVRYFVPEVNSSEDDLQSIINDLLKYNVNFNLED